MSNTYTSSVKVLNAGNFAVIIFNIALVKILREYPIVLQ